MFFELLSFRALLLRRRKSNRIKDLFEKTVEYVFRNNVTIGMINIVWRRVFIPNILLNHGEYVLNGRVSHKIVQEKDNFCSIIECANDSK